jgi:hypothetical protein
VKLVNESNNVVIETEKLEELLKNGDVENKKVVMIGIVGDSESRKNSFLNHCLKFMYANVGRTFRTFRIIGKPFNLFLSTSR